MPKSKSKSFTFYDKEGNDYPFFSPDGLESSAVRNAVRWARKHGIKLYRKRPR